MKAPPLSIFLYQDPLCAWCYVADQRLHAVARELGDAVRLRYRPYALRTSDGLPTPAEVEDALRELERAKKEPEGKLLSDELWTGEDLPRSSVSTLAALEAARMQGAEARSALFHSLQRAALERGINVTRADVVFELASQLGLQMNRFAAIYQSQRMRELILEEQRVASDRGVEGVPTLIIGGQWMVSGLREKDEYRELILACLGKKARAAFPSRDRMVMH